MRSKIISLIALLLVLCLSFCSCDALLGELDDGTLGDIEDIIGDQGGNGDQSDDGNGDQGGDKEDGSPIGGSGAVSSFSLAIVAKYSGEPYFVINNNIPFFEDSEKSAKSFEEYGDLDPKGRCTYAYACIGKDLMPPEGDERGSISSVKPTGWIQASYSEEIKLQYLYNRAHLIGWQLTDEDANKSNLITGTREMNETMIPFENMVADYVKETGNHVLYRATPVYSGDNLVASGVLLEAYSVEDEGDGISFNVFIYNVQPQIWINYATGESRYVGEGKDLGDLGVGGAEEIPEENGGEGSGENTEPDADLPVYDDTVKKTYVINKNSGKIHCEDCASVGKMSEANKQLEEMTEKELHDLVGTVEGEITYTCCLTCKPDKKAVLEFDTEE